MPIGAKMYEAASKEEATKTEGGDSEKKNSDEPVEGEVVDEKDKK